MTRKFAITSLHNTAIVRQQLSTMLKASSSNSVDPVTSAIHPMRVAYQGEPGAYSEKASRELLGSRIVTVPCPSFESVFKAVAAKEVDYAVVPIENSLGNNTNRFMNNFSFQYMLSIFEYSTCYLDQLHVPIYVRTNVCIGI